MVPASAGEARESVPSSGEPCAEKVAEGVQTYGNALFRPGATVIGREACRTETLRAGRQLHMIWPDVEFGDIVVTAPAVTFRDELTLHVGEFAELAESERLVATVHRAYAELEGRPPGEPLDIPGVWADTEQMNGGRPVACHA